MSSFLHQYVFVYLTSQNLYHLAAFLLTGAGSMYTIQLVKVLKKNKLGKNTLRFLNGAFNTLYTAIPAIALGGMSLGKFALVASSLTTLSAVLYRVHNSLLFQKWETVTADTVAPPPVTFAESA